MASRFITRSILVIGLVFLMGTTAGARIGGQSTTQTSCTQALQDAGFCTCPNGICSIRVDGILNGLKNESKNPAAYAVTIFIQQGNFYCKNPAGNTLEGNGVPFTATVATLDGVQSVDAADVTKNGRFLADVIFHDADMIDAIIDAKCGATPPDQCQFFQDIQCQNPNWIQVVLVKKLQVFGEQFNDPTPTNPLSCNLDSDPVNIDNTCTLVDALGQQCLSPIAANPNDQNALDKSLVAQEFTYSCTELCHNVTGTLCPDPPALITP
jgi:hypothetical protein